MILLILRTLSLSLSIERTSSNRKKFCQTERKRKRTYPQNTEEGFLRSKHMLSFRVSGETKMQISNVGGVAREHEIQNNSCLLFIGQWSTNDMFINIFFFEKTGWYIGLNLDCWPGISTEVSMDGTTWLFCIKKWSLITTVI